MLKLQTVAEKTAKKFRGPLFSAAPCMCSNSPHIFSLVKLIISNLQQQMFLFEVLGIYHSI